MTQPAAASCVAAPFAAVVAAVAVYVADLEQNGLVAAAVAVEVIEYAVAECSLVGGAADVV